MGVVLGPLRVVWDQGVAAALDLGGISDSL